MSKTKQHILIVDDELEIRKVIQEILNDEGYSTAIASSADEARKQANKKKPDLVFLDIWMPEEDGISLLKDWAKQTETDFPVIMISGHATIETAIKATKLGAKDFIEKPVSMEKLLTSTAEVLSQTATGEDASTHLLQNIPTFIETLESFKTGTQQKKILVIQSEEGLDRAAWARAIHSKYLSGDIGFKGFGSSQKEARPGQRNKDLNDALNENLIAGAAVDVFSKEPAKENILFNNPKVILTPHIAASTAEASIVVAEMVANQISDFLLKGVKINTV